VTLRALRGGGKDPDQLLIVSVLWALSPLIVTAVVGLIAWLTP
jgi:type III secretory pathway component EscS